MMKLDLQGIYPQKSNSWPQNDGFGKPGSNGTRMCNMAIAGNLFVRFLGCISCRK